MDKQITPTRIARATLAPAAGTARAAPLIVHTVNRSCRTDARRPPDASSGSGRFEPSRASCFPAK
jgi:hypothetical protein